MYISSSASPYLRRKFNESIHWVYHGGNSLGRLLIRPHERMRSSGPSGDAKTREVVMAQRTIQDILPTSGAIPGQLFAALISSSDDAIVAKSLAGVIASWNPGAMRLYGYTSDEVIGQPMTMLCPPERQGEIAGILTKVKNGQRISHYETIRQRKDGTTFPVSVSVSCINDEYGNTIGAACITRDITEQKQARTAEALAQRNRDIELANQKLTDFTFLISHDLRSPLRALAFYSGLLMKECADDLREDRRGYIEQIATVSEKMSALIENLL